MTQQTNPLALNSAVMRMHQHALVFDGHNDLAWQIRQQAQGDFANCDIAQPQMHLHTDIPRLRKGGVGAQFWSVYVPGTHAQPTRDALEQFAVVHNMVKRYADVFAFASSAEQIMPLRAAGKIASLIGVEGGHTLENSLAVLQMFYLLGARYLTLTHNQSLDWADSATDQAKCGGLSAFGERVVQTLNNLGMLVDISHVSADCMRAVLQVSRSPVIASHSSAYAVCPHPRNVPDDVLRQIRHNRGLVMVNFYSGFVVPQNGTQVNKLGSIENVIDHIDHIVEVAGIEHVGLGADFDGMSKLPAPLKDVSSYPYITQALINRGYSEEDIYLILGKNALRVLHAAELKKAL